MQDPITGQVTEIPAGSGQQLPRIYDLQLASDGDIFAMAGDPNTDGWILILRVDPDTGAWTTVFEAFRQEFNVVDTANCVTGAGEDVYRWYPRQGLAVGPNDELFFYAGAYQVFTHGVLGVSADGSTCRVVSMWTDPAAEPQPPSGTHVGTGPGYSFEATGFRYRAGYLWFNDMTYGPLRMDVTDRRLATGRLRG